MKANKWVNKVKDKASDLMDAALCKDNQHSEQLRRKMAMLAGIGLVAVVSTGAVIMTAKSLNREVKGHKDWKEQDAKLDAAVEDTLDASDAIAKY